MNDISHLSHIVASGFYTCDSICTDNIKLTNFIFLMKSAKSSLVNAFPFVFIKMFSDTIFISGTSSAPCVSGLKVLVPADKLLCLM